MDQPACAFDALAVGAIDDMGLVANSELTIYSGDASYFSTHYGEAIDFWAPGVDIKIRRATGDSTQTGTYARQWGTSFSAPHVAAVWARLRAQCPQLNFDQLLNKLKTQCPTVSFGGMTRPEICLPPGC